ncbi:phosphopantetheine-binding protein [Streptomyces sp. NBC_01102]|uniref:phosphopantetheine-binding protein n=1 Tax=unclassified Streptomyces TaxID=2593676 RepID=UPI00386A7E4B|nr:phosphopantetheine-binding protein [Streptomyces sp. NBC_01102]
MREHEVSRIWAELLGIDEADVNANFFDIGGHSLLLMDLAGRFERELNINPDVLMLLEYPTIALFTAHWNSLQTPIDGNG